MAKIEIERVITEYFMLKTVLKNKYAMDIVSGKVEPAGPTAESDKRTLQAMQRYVKTLDELVIGGSGLSSGETLENYLVRITKTFKDKEAAKPEGKRLEYSENPFDENFKHYVSALLSTENAKSKIETAITSNDPVMESVNSLAINLGGKKQSSYIKVLAESTELFSTVSGLQTEIEKLTKAKKADKARIKTLKEKLAEKTAEAQKYKESCEKAIEELGKASGSTVLVGLLKETSNSLEGVIRQESQQTREHVSNEADRVIENMQKKDKIKSYILRNPKDFTRYIKIYQGNELNNKGLRNAYSEIQYAASQVSIAEDDPAVEALFNEISEQNLKNTMNSTRDKNPQKGKRFLPIVAGVLLAASMATTIYFGVTNAHLHQDLHDANDKITEITNNNNNNDGQFEHDYQEYLEREKNQLSDYNAKLKVALEDGTFVTIENDGQITPGDSSINGWNQTTLSELRAQYAADDDLETYGWSSTALMDSTTENALNNEKASYYKTHYEDMVKLVDSLNQQINDLNVELENAHKLIMSSQIQIGDMSIRISELENQVASLQAKVDDLQSIIDAGNGSSSDLQKKLDELKDSLEKANQKIAELESQNESLTQENQQLKQEINELNSKISSLEGTVDGLNSKIASLENENSILAADKAQLQIEAARLQTTIDELQERLDSLIGSDASQTIAALENKISDLQEKLDAANLKISSLESTNEQLTQKITELETNIDNLEKDVNNLKDVAKENASLKEQVEKLKSSLANSEKSYNDLLEDYKNLENSSSASQEELERVKAELISAYNTISAYEQQIVDLYNGITKKDTNSSQAKQDLEELFKMFGIDYNEWTDSPSNDNSEYQP